MQFIVVHCFVNDEKSLALTRLGLSIGEYAMKKKKGKSFVLRWLGRIVWVPWHSQREPHLNPWWQCFNSYSCQDKGQWACGKEMMEETLEYSLPQWEWAWGEMSAEFLRCGIRALVKEEAVFSLPSFEVHMFYICLYRLETHLVHSHKCNLNLKTTFPFTKAVTERTSSWAMVNYSSFCFFSQHLTS